MKSTYKTFKESVKEITSYYLLLVEETKSQRLVGSTNEWVLDNYYMISEQEKVLKVDLNSREFRKIDNNRKEREINKQMEIEKENNIDNIINVSNSINNLKNPKKNFRKYNEISNPSLIPIFSLALVSK